MHGNDIRWKSHSGFFDGGEFALVCGLDGGSTCYVELAIHETRDTTAWQVISFAWQVVLCCDAQGCNIVYRDHSAMKQVARCVASLANCETPGFTPLVVQHFATRTLIMLQNHSSAQRVNQSTFGNEDSSTCMLLL